jgi:hypothetical protein
MVVRGGRLILAVAALLLVALPVEASSGAACPKGSGCVWDQTEFRGTRTKVPSAGCLDSKIQSAVNTSDGVLILYVGGGCQGPRAGTLGPGQDFSHIEARSATGDCSQDPVDPCGGGTVPPAP